MQGPIDLAENISLVVVDDTKGHQTAMMEGFHAPGAVVVDYSCSISIWWREWMKIRESRYDGFEKCFSQSIAAASHTHIYIYLCKNQK
jgi:hypothetical protein